MPVEQFARLFIPRGLQQPRGFALPVFGGIRIRIGFFCRHIAGFAGFVQVDRRTHFGPTMFSGRTTASKVSSSTKPSLIASSLRVVPFLCAVLATLVALS